MRVLAPIALVLVMGCSFDWDSVDPRLVSADGGAAAGGAGASGGSGGGGSGGSCAVGEDQCDALCVDLQTDILHCGDCTTSCPESNVCVGGNCRLPASCKALHEARPKLGDGSYSLDPSGTDPFDAHCDMTIEGGGWTLVASVVDNSYFNGTRCVTACDLDPATTCDESPFTEAPAVGDVADMLVADHKSAAYASVAFDEMLFVDSNAHYVSYDVSGRNVQTWFPAGLVNQVSGGIEAHDSFSYPAKASDLDPSVNACATLRVSFNVEDSDSGPSSDCHVSAKGPVWSDMNNNACYWDDGGVSWTNSAFYAGNSTSYRLWLVR